MAKTRAIKRKICRIGSSHGIIIPKPILEVLGWTRNTALAMELSIDVDKGTSGLCIRKKGR